jgi:hypothetical protein
MKLQSVVGIDGSLNHQRNEPAHILDMVQKTTASGRRNYQGSSNGMELEAVRRMVKKWEDDQKVVVVVTGQDSKWKNLDISEAQASLRRYRAESQKSFKKNDPLSGSTQANE